MPHTSPYTFRLFAGGLIVVLGLAALAVWHFTRFADPPKPIEPEPPQPDPPTPDPRLVFDTPYRNVKPDVKYVGDAACAECHLAIAKSYHAHPMGRSAEFVSQASPIEKYNPSGHTTFSSGGFDLEVEKSPSGVRHEVRLRGTAPAPVADFAIPAEIAIGSGTRGRSYLSVENGAVWQTPISWYGPEDRWDVSPGFRLGIAARRAIVSACLYCHVNRVEPISGADNRYLEPVFPRQLAIGCERCHGPGELHVAERKMGAPAGMDTSIVNPHHLSPPLKAAICEQCHLQGEERILRRGRDLFEFRPGLPFEQFVSVYVRHPDIAAPNRSVGQFEQMEQSRCFSASRGGLLCTSCHDPHFRAGARSTRFSLPPEMPDVPPIARVFAATTTAAAEERQLHRLSHAQGGQFQHHPRQRDRSQNPPDTHSSTGTQRASAWCPAASTIPAQPVLPAARGARPRPRNRAGPICEEAIAGRNHGSQQPSSARNRAVAGIACTMAGGRECLGGTGNRPWRSRRRCREAPGGKERRRALSEVRGRPGCAG